MSFLDNYELSFIKLFTSLYSLRCIHSLEKWLKPTDPVLYHKAKRYKRINSFLFHTRIFLKKYVKFWATKQHMIDVKHTPQSQVFKNWSPSSGHKLKALGILKLRSSKRKHVIWAMGLWLDPLFHFVCFLRPNLISFSWSKYLKKQIKQMYKWISL